MPIVDPRENHDDLLETESREETGVEITPTRPHALDEHTLENEKTGDTTAWTTVCFGAVADTTSLDTDPGLEDETITDVGLFDGLPETVANREWTEPIYRRCRSETAPS